MSAEMKLLIGVSIFGALVAAAVLFRVLPKRLKRDKFTRKWKQLQENCRDKATWSQAIISADKLLDEALKKRKFKGKTMGERLVSAGSRFTNNDGIWFAHNLCKKVLTDPDARLKEKDVMHALVGVRQGLRDLGALPTSQPEKETKEATS